MSENILSEEQIRRNLRTEHVRTEFRTHDELVRLLVRNEVQPRIAERIAAQYAQQQPLNARSSLADMLREYQRKETSASHPNPVHAYSPYVAPALAVSPIVLGALAATGTPPTYAIDMMLNCFALSATMSVPRYVRDNAENQRIQRLLDTDSLDHLRDLYDLRIRGGEYVLTQQKSNIRIAHVDHDKYTALYASYDLHEDENPFKTAKYTSDLTDATVLAVLSKGRSMPFFEFIRLPKHTPVYVVMQTAEPKVQRIYLGFFDFVDKKNLYLEREYAGASVVIPRASIAGQNLLSPY